MQADSLVNDLPALTKAALLELDVDESSSLLLGVSGGLDSMTLAFVLHQLQKLGAFERLVICHVDHKLRGDESDGDAEFVRSTAASWDIQCEIVQLGMGEAHDLHANSTEASARNARYQVFERAAARLQISVIVTAHTANDQSETVLMRMMRGAGPRGLAGIPRGRLIRENLRVIRPWLNVSRSVIENFASDHDLQHREDSTNTSPIYLRNRVRHELLPLMETLSAVPIADSLVRMADLMRDQSRYFDAEAEMLFFQDDRQELELDLFMQAPQPIKFAALELLMHRNGAKEMLSTKTFARILSWLSDRQRALTNSDQERRPNSVFELRGGYRLRLANERLRIGREETLPEIEPAELRSDKPVRTIEGELRLAITGAHEMTHSKDIAYFDCDALGSDHVIVRSWKPGARMHPFGMEGRKLLSDILNEAGVRSGPRKKAFPIVVHPVTGEALWVPGIRRSNGYLISSSSARILVCSLIPEKAH